MKICLVTSEITPFAKTGGLADVSAALGKYLKRHGMDVRLVMPLYSVIDTQSYDFHEVSFARTNPIWMGTRRFDYSVWTAKLPGSDADVYFIHCPTLFGRNQIYTNDSDEHIRFALLARAAIELCQKMGWAPDIFHINDWQTALLPVYLKTLYAWDKLFSNSKTLLTIHNIAYQGKFPAAVINDLSLNEHYAYFDGHDLYQGELNFLKTGVLQADFISTVSDTYAREIQTPYFGEGLEMVLHHRQSHLTGILNGVDYDEWNPETDAHIPFNYSLKRLSGKKKNKKELLEQMGLSYQPDVPLLGMIARLAEQKGIDLIMAVLPEILARQEIRMVVLGSGEEQYESFFYHTQINFKEKFVFYRGYNYPLAHLIEAGSDMFLMPSRFEPGGLNQIYSLKYGAIPVVRKTGGLADSVEPYDWKTQQGTGFVFEHYTPEGLSWALDYALTTYQNKSAWKKLMLNAMKRDFSWDKQILKYIALYKRIRQL